MFPTWTYRQEHRRARHHQIQHLQEPFRFRGIILHSFISCPQLSERDRTERRTISDRPAVQNEILTKLVRRREIYPENAIILMCLSFNTLLYQCECPIMHGSGLGTFIPHAFSSAVSTIFDVYRLVNRGATNSERLWARSRRRPIVFENLRNHRLQLFMIHC